LRDRSSVFTFAFITEHALAVFTVTVATVFVIFPLMNFDIFWHMANGREMLAQWKIINEEVFSYTAQGTQFHNHEWLSQVVFYFIYEKWGVLGLVNLKALIVALAAISLYGTVRFTGADRLSASLIVLTVVAASVHRFTIRPHIFSLLFLCIVQFLLYGYKTERVKRYWIFLIPFIMVLWDMFHGAIYGLIFLLAFMVSVALEAALDRFGDESKERMKWTAVVVLLSLVFMAISPYGLRNYGLFFEFGNKTNLMVALVEEFNPTKLNEFGLFWTLLAVVVVIGTLTFRKAHLPWLVLVLPFAVMSIRYNRAIPAFAMVSAPVLGMLFLILCGTGYKKIPQLFKFLTTVLFIVLVICLGYLKFGPSNVYSFGYGLNNKYVPSSAMRFLKQTSIEGNIYNNGEYGGLIAYELYPEKKMFMYNHHIIFEKVFIETQSRRIFKKYNITHAMLNYKSPWNNLLFKSEEWTPVHWDGDAAILVKNINANKDIIDNYALHYYLPGTSIQRLRYLTSAMPYSIKNFVPEIIQTLTYTENKDLAVLLSEILLSDKYSISAMERLLFAKDALKAKELNSDLNTTLKTILGN
jgi:hypothetical protein